MTEPTPRHRARKSLGQNFLVDPNLQRRIVHAIAPQKDDEVLEIGPGTGALTGHLVGRVGRLTLVELDRNLAATLEANYAHTPAVTVLNRDFLSVDLEEVATDVASLKVIGNIPYNITTPIVFHLLERRVRPQLIVLLVQREVADRILAPPGTKSYGALSVGVRTVADVERVFHVGRKAFRPVPKVDSTVIRIVPRTAGRPDEVSEAALRTLTRAAFGQRRKQFQRILRDALGVTLDELESLSQTTGFDLTARPETFSPDSFLKLTSALLNIGRLTFESR
jgi:16S rRNA (adenine1518-N6/adenine1519-N6)-dimethyltransferase